MSGQRSIEKIPSGIPGLDHVAEGGFPKGRSVLVAGTAGSAKTVLASQFLAGGIAAFREAGVFVTFEEPPDDIRRNLLGFGWDVAGWEAEGRWAFVDASPDPAQDHQELGDFELGGLLARIGHAVRRTGATRLVLDSLGAIYGQFRDTAVVRRDSLT